MTDKYNGRKTPPEEDDWLHIWDGIDKAHKSWIITGPLHAVVSNWKALLVIFAILMTLNGPEIIDVLRGYVEK